MLNKSEKLSYDYQNIPLTVSVMRNSRLRTFLYIALGGVICFTVYLLSTTHSHLKDVESSKEKCLQQRDSLSAQLQVVYEHKNRLEKSLQQEKVDHKHTKEEQDKQKNELHVRMEREKHTLESRYNNILQEQEALQNKYQQLQNEIADLKNNQGIIEDEKKQLMTALSSLETLKQQKEEEITKMKDNINQLILEKEDLQKSNENQVWKMKQHTDELQLCRGQYEQLANKMSQLELQFHKLSVNNNIDRNLQKKSVHDDHDELKDHLLKENNKFEEKEQLPNQNLQINKEAAADNDRKMNANIENFVQPKPLQRSNVKSNTKTAEQVQSQDNVIQPPIDNESHKSSDVLKKPFIHNAPFPSYNDINSPNEIVNNIQDSKPAQDTAAHQPHIKSMDFLQNEENLHQVQPPRNFDKVEVDNKQDKFPQANNNFDQYHAQQSINNVLPQPNNIKETDKQNGRQVGSEDGQEHGVLIKPPLDGNHGHKIVHNVESLKRGPQMVNEKNGHHHQQQDEEGDYAEDGDDDNADDQDAEANDDDQLMVGDHAGHGKVFQDADFDDQDNGVDVEEKNAANQDKEEGVMVAPK